MTTSIVTNDFQTKSLTKSLIRAHKQSFLDHTLNKERGGGFRRLEGSFVLQPLQSYLEPPNQLDQPKRKSLNAPFDDGTFVKPIKQSFVHNPRLMPMTRIMLTQLTGWMGKGRALETTIGIIAKKIRRSPRMVWNYLQDAVEEGYLRYTRTKNRKGLYTGIRIYLNFAAIRFQTLKKKAKKQPQRPVHADMKYPSDTNYNHYNSRGIDEDLITRLLKIGETMGYYEKKRTDL